MLTLSFPLNFMIPSYWVIVSDNIHLNHFSYKKNNVHRKWTLNFRPASANTNRTTILPSYTNETDSMTHQFDPSFRIMRCTSMEAVRRNEQIAPILANEKFHGDNSLKQRMSSNKKQIPIPTQTLENCRSQSFSLNTPLNNINLSSSSNQRYHHYQNSDIAIQKPRVYTRDDSLLISRQNHQIPTMLSSSSTSSSLSVKDKITKDINDSR